MNYFFVFQNKSFEIEYNGGYLWAPKAGENGRRVSHWESMRAVKKGDIIIHSYNKKLVAVSIAQEDCREAMQPEALKQERLWQDDGYMIYTKYIFLEESIITSEYMETILKLQPAYNAPFNRVGRGNTGYLFNSNKHLTSYLLKEILKVQTNGDIISVLNEIISRCDIVNYNIQDVPNDIISEETVEYLTEKIEDITDTEKLTLIKSRVGHGTLKKKLLQKENKCAICGLRDERFLIASHIKSWNQSNAQERLDINNVLLLCPHHDAVFDKGYISFHDDGKILISDELSFDTRVLLNISIDQKIKVNPLMCKYIQWHRKKLFKGSIF